ncbi:hypothetical protein H072_2463 [Dactylellina haptotyla CBS 200.50]|uniref:DUF7029 domain-containing protein n=1 Tax=Dactylellina haptotyla (strain CBS 200.50) TaxID=1284197 RepID=S8BVM3_DACHA|nr:hypothetical protein H072_2463 [Dactylellina haptotyla CBS 200.50]
MAMLGIKVLVLSVGFFGLQAYAGPVLAIPSEPIQLEARSNDPTSWVSNSEVKLLPIRDDHFFPHLKKRDLEDFSALELRHEVQFLYGKDSTYHNPGSHLAEMKISQSHPDNPITLLENFDHFTTHTTCPDEEKLLLKFINKRAMDCAIKSWDWINEDQDSYFYMITHHDHEGCGEDEQRTPYKIVAVEHDVPSLTATLIRQKTSWDDAAKNFELHIGNIDHPAFDVPGRPKIHRREIANNINRIVQWTTCAFSPATCVVGIFVDAKAREEILPVVLNAALEIIPSFEVSKAGSFSYQWGIKNYDLYKASPAANTGISLTCVDCSLRGSLGVYVSASKTGNGKMAVNVKVQPNAQGLIKLKAMIKTEIKKSKTPDLIQIPLAPAGIGIPGIGNLGLTLVVTPGIEGALTVKGEISSELKISTGKGEIGGTYGTTGARLVQGNWPKDPGFNLEPPKGELTAKGSLDVYAKLGVRAGLSLFSGKRNLGAFVGVKAAVSSSVTAGFQSGGFCPKDKTQPGQWGIQFDSKFTVEAGVDFENDFLPEDTKKALKTLFPDFKTKGNIVGPLSVFPGGKCFATTGKGGAVPGNTRTPRRAPVRM